MEIIRAEAARKLTVMALKCLYSNQSFFEMQKQHFRRKYILGLINHAIEKAYFEGRYETKVFLGEYDDIAKEIALYLGRNGYKACMCGDTLMIDWSEDSSNEAT